MRAGDERVVVGDVGEGDQPRAADAARGGGRLGQRLDDAAHLAATASMLMPARVVATFTDEQTRVVVASASGIESMSARSPGVMPFSTSAEKPPT